MEKTERKSNKPATKMKKIRQSDDLPGKNSHKNSEKHKSKKKAGRLIVRNVAFTASEDEIRKHFAKCGRIRNIKLLTKADGKFIGCCFVEFFHLLHAQKAISELNSSKIKGRIIAVDWAIEKSRYSKLQQQSNKSSEKSTEEIKPIEAETTTF